MQRVPDVAIERLPQDFDRWQELLALIMRSFAYMDGVIDPPSSARLLTVGSLNEKAENEICFLAFEGSRLAGCVFAAEHSDAFYVGKLAVDPTLQGMGIGRALMHAVESLALQAGKSALELQSRVELHNNHAAFKHMGFVEMRRSAHPGFVRPTSITFRKRLA